MSNFAWYWHRLRAMSFAEMARHARKKLRQRADGRRLPDWSRVPLANSGRFPKLPAPGNAPTSLRDALALDVENILAGRWKAFGHLDLQVDDPPKWHRDYLAGRDLATAESAFRLDHRALPGGADVKLVWELSRWYPLVRLAMAAHVLGDSRAAEKCVAWLEDWVKHNPPYRGWNWTSALEAGMRLIQFTWMDALLSTGEHAASLASRLAALRAALLPPHVWYAWRHQSFGSSANNHLLGELVGCLVATVRWPNLARWGASLDELQVLWEREVLAQFAPDGGNREQALNYQLYSWEFCWQAQAALRAAGRTTTPLVEERIALAGAFFWEVQVKCEPWDYGDSDNAFVLPVFTTEQDATREWRNWISEREASPSLKYWLDEPPRLRRILGRGTPVGVVPAGPWWYYKDSGIAICESGFWWLRWDLSPLGYLRTAAHGHLDALHLSVWCKGVAMVIDPGTGAYYADPRVRAWLASRAAHNGPCPSGAESPRRLGPFLWAGSHAIPELQDTPDGTAGTLELPDWRLRRWVEFSPGGWRWTVSDQCIATSGSGGAFTVRWQFAPGAWVKRLSERKFAVHRADVAVFIEVDEGWSEVELVEPGTTDPPWHVAPEAEPLEGLVSPAFRKLARAPFLKLTALTQTGEPGVFRTKFSMPEILP